MRAATCCMLGLAWAALWCVPAADAASRCAKFDESSHKAVRASSFAPHSNSGNHVYGAPIQKPILKHRPKPKPQVRSEPQLKSEPLPQG